MVLEELGHQRGKPGARLGDLSLLPYAEQVYWKSFNEPPKSGISRRAFKSDFLAEWDDSPDPLMGLKRRLEQLHDRQAPWWSLKNDQLLERAHYSVTDSQDEWANELMALDQLVVEGFSRSYFKSQAEAAGITVDPKWQSLKLIDEVLRQQKVNDEEIGAIVSPLKALHELRSKMKGHASGSDAKAIRESLIAKHGSLKSHYRSLAGECDRAVALMMEFAGKGVF